MSTLPPPRLRATDPSLEPGAAKELGRLLIDLTNAALHRDAQGIASLIGTLDAQEAADVIAGLAVGAAQYLSAVHALAGDGHPGACASLRHARELLESGDLLG